MIAVNCYRCGNELGIQGMLIFDVPDLDDRSLKLHVCAPCAPVVVEWLRGGTPGQPHPVERPAAPPGSPERRIDSEDWATIEAARALAEVVSAMPPGGVVRLAAIDAVAVQFRAAYERGHTSLKVLLKETLPFLKRARDHWPETSNPRAFIDEIDELEARIDAAITQNESTGVGIESYASSLHATKGLFNAVAQSIGGANLTTHILFEGHPICGFMAGTVSSGWPDGHNWVSIAEVTWHDGGTSIPLSDHCTPCERCLRFASPPPFVRNRV